jgi:thioredoxin 1
MEKGSVSEKACRKETSMTETEKPSDESEEKERGGAGRESDVSLVDYHAPWCAPCRQQAPVIRALAERYRCRARVEEVDIDRNPSLAKALGIQSIPTMILSKKGREIRRFVGYQTAEKLARALDRALGKT